MKRFGFTLAEVLITLGIIGVISALTLPSLLNDTQGAQVGPKLGKAVSMFEQANQALLTDNNVDSISDIFARSNNDSDSEEGDYFEELSNHLKISLYRGTTYTVSSDASSGPCFNQPLNFRPRFRYNWQSKDGAVYYLNFWGNVDRNSPPHKRHIGVLFIDINGDASPNLPGTDVFAFSLRDDGSLFPVGSFAWAGDESISPTWQTQCPNDSIPRGYYTCTASIFENNMKVMYKMR